ncbi:MAG: hypothetical protein JHC98_01925 [Thermoleophilaceae bacterium]|nr:hypothetical protein [Thermoleophilaceae bacterium]
MTRRVRAAMICALVLAATAAPAEARSISAGACVMKGVKLVDANAYVVVAEVPGDSPGHGKFYPGDRMMCDVAVGTWRVLARTNIDPQYEIVRISGHFVGFSGRVFSCENCTGDDSFVGVKNAATGHTVFMRYMHLTDDQDVKGYAIPDMVLKPNGSVAFTVDGNWRHAWRSSRLVIKHDFCGGTQVLDKSKRHLRLRSLRRDGSQLRWRVGQRLRIATLC